MAETAQFPPEMIIAFVELLKAMGVDDVLANHVWLLISTPPGSGPCALGSVHMPVSVCAKCGKVC